MNYGRRRWDQGPPEWAFALGDGIAALTDGMLVLIEGMERINQKVELLIMTSSEGQAQIDADVNAIEAGLSSFESQNSAGFATLSQEIAKLVSGQTPPTPDNLAALNQLVQDVQAATSAAGAQLASAIKSAAPAGPVSP